MSPPQLRVDNPRISSETAATYGQAGRSELLLQLSEAGDVAYLPAGESSARRRYLRRHKGGPERGTISVFRCGSYTKKAYKPARPRLAEIRGATPSDCLSGRVSNA